MHATNRPGLLQTRVITNYDGRMADAMELRKKFLKKYNTKIKRL